jgi:hypothetical protein
MFCNLILITLQKWRIFMFLRLQIVCRDVFRITTVYISHIRDMDPVRVELSRSHNYIESMRLHAYTCVTTYKDVAQWAL